MRTWLSRYSRVMLLITLLSPLVVGAAQRNVVPPVVSGTTNVEFGVSVTSLPNGNFVVTDPKATVGGVSEAGAVYLYNATGTLISTLTGSHAQDHVGLNSSSSPPPSIVVVGNSNFVVISTDWSNGTATSVGAVTWVNGTTGRNGSVGPANSLVGSTSNDQVGIFGVLALNTGNYVVLSPAWTNVSFAAGQAGAATFGNGNTGVTGPISSSNSLVGVNPNDYVGYDAAALAGNGNYVVSSPFWLAKTGAVTWGNGSTGITGSITTLNSLMGSVPGDEVGSMPIATLTNGNYVVTSPLWNGGSGAATWGNGANGSVVGRVSSTNSLVGTTANDQVGLGQGPGATPLSNGNYVVASPNWQNGGVVVGAATWGDGTTGSLTGPVSSANSLIGRANNDRVSSGGILALDNGAYVASSPSWANDVAGVTGAITLCDSSGNTTGPVTSANSLTSADTFGSAQLIAIPGARYLVNDPSWHNGASGVSLVGAVQHCDATTNSCANVVMSAQPGNPILYGTTYLDQVGWPKAVALSDGSYVVPAEEWTNTATNVQYVGAVTWCYGDLGCPEASPSAANSLVGTAQNDRVGSAGVFALHNGNYVVASDQALSSVGAVTMVYGGTWYSGVVSNLNSLVGSIPNDVLGNPGQGGVQVLADNNYVVQDKTGAEALGP